MGNSTSQVAVKQTRTELSIKPAPLPPSDSPNVKSTLIKLSQLEGEINDLIIQSNIKIIPQDPNPQSIATLDQSFRANQILKQSAAAISSPDDPEISSKLLYIRKHIHRDVFTTYTSNHLISSVPPPLHEIYLVNRDPNYAYEHVYYSRPPVPSKSQVNVHSLQSFHSNQQLRQQEMAQTHNQSRHKHTPRKPSVALSEAPRYSQQNDQLNDSQLDQPTLVNNASQSLFSIVSTPTDQSECERSLPSLPCQPSHSSLNKDSSSSPNLLPPAPDYLIRRSISSLKDAAASNRINSMDSKGCPGSTGGGNVTTTTPSGDPHHASFIYSPIVTQTDSFHADLVSLTSEKDSVVDLGSFPQFKHYASSDFQNENSSDVSRIHSRNGYDFNILLSN